MERIIKIVIVSVLTTILFLLSVAATAPPVRAPTTFEVGVGYPYATISAAVAAASPREYHLVHPGLYMENIVVNIDDLTLKSSDGAPITIVNGGGSDVFTVTGVHITIEGFTVTNGRYGIFFQSGYNVFTKNIICDNREGILSHTLVLMLGAIG